MKMVKRVVFVVLIISGPSLCAMKALQSKQDQIAGSQEFTQATQVLEELKKINTLLRDKACEKNALEARSMDISVFHTEHAACKKKIEELVQQRKAVYDNWKTRKIDKLRESIDKAANLTPLAVQCPMQ